MFLVMVVVFIAVPVVPTLAETGKNQSIINQQHEAQLVLEQLNAFYSPAPAEIVALDELFSQLQQAEEHKGEILLEELLETAQLE